MVGTELKRLIPTHPPQLVCYLSLTGIRLVWSLMWSPVRELLDPGTGKDYSMLWLMATVSNARVGVPLASLAGETLCTACCSCHLCMSHYCDCCLCQLYHTYWNSGALHTWCITHATSVSLLGVIAVHHLSSWFLMTPPYMGSWDAHNPFSQCTALFISVCHTNFHLSLTGCTLLCKQVQDIYDQRSYIWLQIEWETYIILSTG